MNCEKDLHVVAFDIPYPPNYGGVIDVYYKIKALSRAGVRVHLHSFQYGGRQQSEMLDKLCHKVYYYKRRVYKDPFFTKQPYIVASRNSADLLTNLQKDDHPILFEGLHCCHYLPHPALKDRFKIVRMHNLEDIYYRSLARIERNIFKKYFFSVEADRLRQYEKVLEHADLVAAISPDDAKTLQIRYGNAFYLPVFHSNDMATALEGRGDFALYQGNLGVGENNEAALFLVREVFDEAIYPLVIAGMNPSKELQKAVEGKSHIRLLHKVDTPTIYELTQNAQMNVLPTFQSTGMKLKLINVLFQGRHILVNQKMVVNTGLEPLCHIAHGADSMKAMVKRLAKVPFTAAEVQKRTSYLQKYFDNKANTGLLLDRIFSAKLV